MRKTTGITAGSQSRAPSSITVAIALLCLAITVRVQEVTCPQRRLLKAGSRTLSTPTCQRSHWESQGMLVDIAVATLTFETRDKDPFQIKAFWPSRKSADSRVSEGSFLSHFRLCRVLWISVAGTGKAHQRILLEIQVA